MSLLNEWLVQLPKKLVELEKYKDLGVGYQGVKEVTTQIYNKYPKEHTFNGSKVLNVGCGNCTYPASNVTNLDFSEGEGIQVAHDLSRVPLPFDDNSFDFIIANHVLEHIPTWFNCFAELARIVRPGGLIEIWIPTMGTDASFVYRDHINYMGLGSFCGVSNLPRQATNIEGNKHKSVLSLVLVERNIQFIKEWWVLLAPEPLKIWMANHLRNVVSEEGYKFIKREN